jgi:hypothetical protein
MPKTATKRSGKSTVKGLSYAGETNAVYIPKTDTEGAAGGKSSTRQMPKSSNKARITIGDSGVKMLTKKVSKSVAKGRTGPVTESVSTSDVQSNYMADKVKKSAKKAVKKAVKKVKGK